MKMFVEMITESDFLWHGIGTFAQNYLKQAQKMKKIIESIQTICYLRMSLDLKMQDLFETSNNTGNT